MPLSESFTSEDIPRQRKTAGGPGGVLEIYMTGGPTYFFGLNIWTLGIFLGLEIRQVFFWVDKFQSDFFHCLIE